MIGRSEAHCSALVVVAGLLVGCGSDVDIIGECTVGEAARVTDEPHLPSVGLLDGRVFVSIAYDIPSGDPTVARSEWEGFWLDERLAPTGERLWLGSGLISAVRTRWLAGDDALHAHIWTRPEPPEPWSEGTVSLWRVTPPPSASAESIPVGIEIPPPPDDNPAINGFGLGGFYFPPGAEIVFPAVATPRGAAGMIVAIPPECMERLANYYRLHWFSTSQPSATAIRWGADGCELHDSDRQVSAPWLFRDREGHPSVLFRAGAADDGRVRLLRLNDDFTIRDGPRVVGGTTVTTTDDGYQPRAVAVPGGSVLFFERISGGNRCHTLRIMNADGTCAEDAPWQLPCMKDGPYRSDRDIVTSYLELVAVPGGAVAVWGEHTNPRSVRITSDIPYREGIYAALLTPEGQRGSSVVEVTDEAATFLEPIPRTETTGPSEVRPVPSVAVEGDELVVAWPDRRVDAPGVYVRRLTCTVDGD